MASRASATTSPITGEDILGLFTGALDRLGIPWTRSTKYVISIYRKAATARFDEFIGPKC